MTLLSIADSYNDSLESFSGLKYRAAHLIMAPIKGASATIDTISGLFSSVSVILTLGIEDDFNQKSLDLLNSSNKIVAAPFIHLLNVINPNSLVVQNTFPEPGLITPLLFNPITRQAERFTISPNIVHQHITSRLTYSLLAISSIITRVVDTILGTLLATLAFLTLGNIPFINTIAYHALMAPGILHDLSFCTIAIINPYF